MVVKLNAVKRRPEKLQVNLLIDLSQEPRHMPRLFLSVFGAFFRM
jgi:hypothetical protein